MEGRIFISYSRKDLDAVKPIKEELEAGGFSCWMDLEGIESGSPEFTKTIAKAINDSLAVLFFLSDSSQISRWSLNELRLSRDKNRHVVLVRFNNDRMSDEFKLEFGGADVIDWRAPEQREKLLRDLRRWADRINQANEPSSTVPAQRPLKSSLATKRKKPGSKKKRKPPISLWYRRVDWLYFSRYYLSVKNQGSEAICIKVSVRIGDESKVVPTRLIDGNEEILISGKLGWDLKPGDHGTIKVVGWSKPLKFSVDEEGEVRYQ